MSVWVERNKLSENFLNSGKNKYKVFEGGAC